MNLEVYEKIDLLNRQARSYIKLFRLTREKHYLNSAKQCTELASNIVSNYYKLEETYPTF